MEFFEEVMKYKIGIETDIISIEEFSRFIDNEMSRLNDIPDIYIEVALHINKGVKELLSTISDYCKDNRLELTESQDDKIKKYLLNIVKDRYLNKKIDMKECTHCISQVGLYFGQLFELIVLEDCYEFATQGICHTLEDVDNMIKEIFEKL